MNSSYLLQARTHTSFNYEISYTMNEKAHLLNEDIQTTLGLSLVKCWATPSGRTSWIWPSTAVLLTIHWRRLDNIRINLSNGSRLLRCDWIECHIQVVKRRWSKVVWGFAQRMRSGVYSFKVAQDAGVRRPTRKVSTSHNDVVLVKS